MSADPSVGALLHEFKLFHEGRGPTLSVLRQRYEQDPSVLKDLTAVIALNGQSCGQVVSAVRQGENDYLASCKDGNRYRVFTNPQGRVIDPSALR